MLKRLIYNAFKRVCSIRQDCQGFVVVSTLAIFLFLFVLCAFVYAVGETIHQRIKMQNACDAAAYSAAVVQADGLSRMATVNRAMAWSYVQMTNRQMDYITYRWLKLTCQRFDQDLKNAAAFNHLSIFAVDKELGWWALLEVAATAVLSELFDLECSGYGPGDKLPSKVGHRDEGHGYWCGLEVGDRKKHNIRLNVNKEKLDNFGDQAKAAFMDGIANMVFTRDNIGSILSVFDFIDSKEPEPQKWGGRLGTLIDYDKANIRRMNNALARINRQMNISMKMTAESVLKSMLKDNRIDNNNVLKDYFISIHIPRADNPYETDSVQRSAAGKSFFSPLRNTEVDEMFFLNMQSPDKASLALIDHFPRLLSESGEGLASGLDQWFIRGKAYYSDGEEHCYDSSPLKDVTFAPQSGDKHLATMWRNEGALGIQRVYKDSNINDTKAGFGNTREKKIERYVWREEIFLGDIGSGSKLQRRLNEMFPDECCRAAAQKRNEKTRILAHNHKIVETVYESRWNTVWRGNHLIDLMNVANILTDGVKGFIGAQGGGSAADDDDDDPDTGGISVESQEELEDAKRKAAGERDNYLQQKNDAVGRKNALLLERATASPERQQAIDNEIAQLNTEIANYDSLIEKADAGIAKLGDFNPGLEQGKSDDRNFSNEDQGLMGQIASFLLDGISASISNLIGQYLDIQPSCGNNPNLPYTEYPACEQVENPTSALYSEYRWASCKWFCLTKGFTYAVCSIYNIFSGKKLIYCDTPKRTIVKIDLGFFDIKIKGKGLGHYGWPKWFCGNKPTHTLLENLPPLAGSVTGVKHGYMDNVWDFGNDGFLRPIRPLLSDGKDAVFSRQEYESCAMFPDGLDLDPRYGHNAWPGLVRGHARIYADDKEIFDNRYVGAICKPWVLNERFFAGDGTILVGAAMKHTNPFVQLFNMWNTAASGDDKNKTYTTGDETQKNAEKTVLAAFNIPEGNFMWTMSAARAGVRRVRRDGKYDQPRQYQITYDSTCDAENLKYHSGPYVMMQDKTNRDNDAYHWSSPADWGDDFNINSEALSRSVRLDGNILPQIIPLPYRTFVASMPANGSSSDNNREAAGISEEMTHVPVYNGCPCGSNHLNFKNMWNLCETDWDATLLPVRYAWQKAVLYLGQDPGVEDPEVEAFNSKNRSERTTLINASYDYSRQNDGMDDDFGVRDLVLGNGRNWRWNGVIDNATFYMLADPFIISGWKKANTTFFEDIVREVLPGSEIISSALSSQDGLNLNTRIPTGKEEKKVEVLTIIKDRVL